MEDNYTRSDTSCMSDDIREFAKAFIAARLEMPKAVRVSKGNYGNYADIDAIYDACLGPLLNNGIFIYHGGYHIFDASNIPIREILKTRLIHGASGQWTQDERILLYDRKNQVNDDANKYTKKQNIEQDRGSSNTYSKKLAVLSLCALGCEDDDCDSEKEIHIAESKISKQELEILENFIRASDDPEKYAQNILIHNNVRNLSDLSKNSFYRIVIWFQKTKEKNG